ncbi:MAG TPA: hypothetical protein VFZ34_27200 [Blastocatellia bacterium]|nr:hypothetical protein [Blastocatellia bacterium]
MMQQQRSHFIIRVSCVLTVAFIAGGKTILAQPSEPKTVEDFFLQVPERYMVGYDLRLRRELLRGERRGVIVDSRNGYISYDESDNPSGFEFAIFRKRDGSYLVAYSTGAFYDPELSKELDNWPTLLLLRYEGRGKWRDVTRTALPVPFDKKLAYKLPRRGRSIEIWDGQGRKRYSLLWQNDRFNLRRAARS